MSFHHAAFDEYCKGRTLKEISQSNGVSLSSIKKWSAKENWKDKKRDLEGRWAEKKKELKENLFDLIAKEQDKHIRSISRIVNLSISAIEEEASKAAEGKKINEKKIYNLERVVTVANKAVNMFRNAVPDLPEYLAEEIIRQVSQNEDD